MSFPRNLKIRTIGWAFVIALMAVPVHPGKGFALDLGLTPSHVYSLWTNINGSLVTVARVISGDPAWRKRLTAYSARKFEGKRPSDVLRRVADYRAKLDRLLRRESLALTKQLPAGEEEVTPSEVYLNSGFVLNAQVRWLIVNTGPEQTVSQFYYRHDFSGETPSDVFALVDLANRRLDEILSKAGL